MFPRRLSSSASSKPSISFQRGEKNIELSRASQSQIPSVLPCNASCQRCSLTRAISSLCFSIVMSSTSTTKQTRRFLRVPDDAHVHARPDGTAIFPDISFFEPVTVPATGAGFLPRLKAGPAIIRMRDCREVHLGEFVRRVTDEIAKRGIYFQQPSVRVRYRDSDGRMLKGSSKPFFGKPERFFVALPLRDIDGNSAQK